MVGVAIGASAGAGLLGSAISGAASKKAAGEQAQASIQSALIQQAQQNQTRADLAPYNVYGTNTLPLYANFYGTTANQLGQAYSDLANNVPGTMTQAQLEQTPGYQFTLQQGLRGVANSSAAKGLGVSGPALLGAANYATGLANQTYKDQFNLQQQRYQDYLNNFNAKQNQLSTIFGQLSAPVSLGENAAATTGNIGVQSAANQGNALVGAGVAQSAGTTGLANNIASGLQSIGSAPLAYLGLQNALAGSNANTPSSYTSDATF